MRANERTDLMVPGRSLWYRGGMAKGHGAAPESNRDIPREDTLKKKDKIGVR